METKKIHAAMIGIMRDSEAIGKNQENESQGFKFRGIDDVYNSLHAIFAKHGVYVLPENLEHKLEVRQKTSTYKERTETKLAFHHTSKIRFRFIAEDGSEVEAITVGEAVDSGDKGASKAASIAIKYALLQIFLIPTNEEDADKKSWGFDDTPPPPPAPEDKPQKKTLTLEARKTALLEMYKERTEELESLLLELNLTNQPFGSTREEIEKLVNEFSKENMDAISAHLKGLMKKTKDKKES